MKLFRTKKKVKKSVSEREFAQAIIEIFEEKLDELNITLPDKFREGKKDEARIFGDNYYDLEYQISDFIRNNESYLKQNMEI